MRDEHDANPQQRGFHIVIPDDRSSDRTLIDGFIYPLLQDAAELYFQGAVERVDTKEAVASLKHGGWRVSGLFRKLEEKE